MASERDQWESLDEKLSIPPVHVLTRLPGAPVVITHEIYPQVEISRSEARSLSVALIASAVARHLVDQRIVVYDGRVALFVGGRKLVYSIDGAHELGVEMFKVVEEYESSIKEVA